MHFSCFLLKNTSEFQIQCEIGYGIIKKPCNRFSNTIMLIAESAYISISVVNVFLFYAHMFIVI